VQVKHPGPGLELGLAGAAASHVTATWIQSVPAASESATRLTSVVTPHSPPAQICRAFTLLMLKVVGEAAVE
jgi:hypothetical protein